MTGIFKPKKQYRIDSIAGLADTDDENQLTLGRFYRIRFAILLRWRLSAWAHVVSALPSYQNHSKLLLYQNDIILIDLI